MRAFFENSKLTLKNFRTAFIASLLISLIIGIAMFRIYHIKLDGVKDNYVTEMTTAVNITESFLTQKIQSLEIKINNLTASYELKQYIKDAGEYDTKAAVETLFKTHMENNVGILQLRIINPLGQETLRINRIDNSLITVPEDELQNKKSRYYFTESMIIPNNALYISDFDLNIENGNIVEPYEPTIRFIKKLFDDDGRFFGLLVLNIDGYDFLKVIKEYELTNMQYKEIGILDSNNFWSMSNTGNNDLNEIVLTINDRTTDAVYSNLESYFKVIGDETKGSFFYGDKGYVYRALDAGLTSPLVIQNEVGTWYVLGYFDMTLLTENQEFTLKNIVLLTAIYCTIGFFITYLIMILFQIQSNKNLLLMVSSYISDNSHDGIVILDHKKLIIYCNPVFEDIFGFKRNKAVNKSISELFNGHINFKTLTSDDTVIWQGNVWNKTQYGNLIYKHLTVKVIRNNHSQIVYYIGIYCNPDVTEMANDITSIPDVGTFMISQDDANVIGDFINDSIENEERYAILAVQITGNIRKVFESNQLLHGKFMLESLQELAEYESYNVLAMPRTDLLIASMAYDEKLLTEDNLVNEDRVREVINNIEKLIKKTLINMKLEQLDFKVNVGIAVKNYHGKFARDIFKNALIALEALNKFKKSNYLVYNEVYSSILNTDLDLRKGLLEAFEKNEFYVSYQPQFSVSNNKIIGFEALARWENKKLGKVPPEKFIAILEETSGILKFGNLIMDLAIADMRRVSSYVKGLRISINLSSQEFVDSYVLDRIIEKSKQFKLLGMVFCVEITESTLIKNLEVANKIVGLLQSHDIEVSIDDFGTGYSSLGYLKSLSVNEFKIDRMFIKDYPEKDDGKIIKAIISMGKELKNKLVVEGVEEAIQLDLIKEMSCDFYQGYFAAKPMTLLDLAKLLAKE